MCYGGRGVHTGARTGAGRICGVLPSLLILKSFLLWLVFVYFNAFWIFSAFPTASNQLYSHNLVIYICLSFFPPRGVETGATVNAHHGSAMQICLLLDNCTKLCLIFTPIFSRLFFVSAESSSCLLPPALFTGSSSRRRNCEALTRSLSPAEAAFVVQNPKQKVKRT